MKQLVKVAMTTVGTGLLVASLVGCSSSPAPSGESQESHKFQPHTGKLRVVTSVAVWADIAQDIGGPLVQASAIIGDPNRDPHSYEATVRDQLAVNQADLTIANGADYDPFFTKLVASRPAKSAGRSLTLAAQIDQHTPNPNPHLWYNLSWVKTIAARIGAVEAQAMPTKSSKDAIVRRTVAFVNRVTSLEKQQRALAKSVVGKSVILTESFALPMTRNLAMVDQTPAEFRNAVEQDQDASPAVMALMRNLMSHGRVNLLVVNRQTQGVQTNQLIQWAQDRRVPVLQLSELLPNHTTYLRWMQQNLSQIAEALK